VELETLKYVCSTINEEKSRMVDLAPGGLREGINGERAEKPLSRSGWGIVRARERRSNVQVGIALVSVLHAGFCCNIARSPETYPQN
jgi:hypothetical protein